MAVKVKVLESINDILEKINYLAMKMNKHIISIDPGASGGLCVYSNNTVIEAMPCPDNANKMADLIQTVIHNLKTDGITKSNITAVIENVHAFPTDGRSSAFKFGRNFGMWLGIFASNKLNVVQVNPYTWMKSFGDMPKAKQERKKYLKELAKSLFPDARVTLKTADAILMAKYYNELE